MPASPSPVPSPADAILEEALSLYAPFLSPDELADYREVLHVILATHPVLAPMADRLRERPVVEKSSEVDREAPPAPADADPTAKPAKAGGHR